ncbi:MucBP domain-containing protein [Arcanobacterium haemolyticum]|nr:MucBP domain-containing protein [Arcanobacterium haemolyticum]
MDNRTKYRRGLVSSLVAAALAFSMAAFVPAHASDEGDQPVTVASESAVPTANGNAATEETSSSQTSQAASASEGMTNDEAATDAHAVPVPAAAPVLAPAAADALTEVWVSSAGSDDNDGSSADQAFATMAKALAVSGVTTINVSGTFSTWPSVTIPNGVTLKIVGDTAITGPTNTNGITLANGATLTAGSSTLTTTGFNVALQMNAGAKLTDGTYVMSGGNRALNLGGGVIEGSADRSSVVINATGTSGADFQAGSITNATITATATTNGPEHYALAQMKNASLTTTQTWYYINPGRTFSLDHSDLYINKATAAPAYRQAITFGNDPIITNGSTLTADGGRISVADGSKSFNVTNGSKIVIKNSIGRDLLGRDGGGLNINATGANVRFVDSTLETTNIDTYPSYGTRGTSSITFAGNSQVITDHKNKTYDNGGADRSTGGSYVVTGGSFYVTYDPNFNAAVTTPTNGEPNGNEMLSYFTLADSSVNSFNPINANGERYEYNVANASPDGKKYVFAPAAKVSFKLNNGNAKFADGTSADKVQSTVRGYKLGFVEGTSDVGTPTDPNVAFLGWFYKDAAGAEHAFDFANTEFTADTDVYAKWDSKTVIYHNGSGVDYIQSVPASENTVKALSYDEVVAQEPNFVVPGKTFNKWTEGSAATSKEIPAGSTLTFAENTTQIDVYAQFSTDSYRVAFSANGGTFSDDSVFKKNPEIFTIEKDRVLGGEVAVVTKGATYNQKLSEVLGSFARGQITPTATAATKPGSKLGDTDQWNTASDGTGSRLRFDDTKVWFFTTPGADPEFTADTTYYLMWTPDTTTPIVSQKFELKSDLWGDSLPGQKDSTSALKVTADGKEPFSLTGVVDVSGIKKQMLAIESMFPNTKPADITLTDTASTFTATLELPRGVNVPANLTKESVSATGLGDLFEVKSAVVEGQNVSVTFGLTEAYTSYEELKAAVGASGTQTAFRMAATSPIADRITLTVPGFTLANTLKNGDELTVTGTVEGTFASVASAGSKIQRFDLTWAGTQVAGGKDYRAVDDSTIQQTIVAKVPYEADLPSDMLVYVQPENPAVEDATKAGIDSTSSAPAGVYQGSKINLTGTIDASVVKNQMAGIEAIFNNPADLESIKLSDLSSSFTATFTVPDGLTLPALAPADAIAEGFADTFAVTSVEAADRVVTVTFTLKSGIENYKQLKDAVSALGDTMKFTVPGIAVDADVADGTTLTTVGTVSGTFDAVATSAAGTEKDFSFIWTGKQTEGGKDKSAPDLNTIQLTLATPNPMDLDLPSDMLSGKDTEHEAVYPAFAGSTIGLTGAVKIDGIKQQMAAIEQQFGNPDGSTIAVDIKNFGFTATMTMPDGMTLPADLDAAKVIPEGMAETFEVTAAKVEGKTVTITFGLKNLTSITTYKQLKDAVYAAGVDNGMWLKVTVPGVKLADDLAANAQLTSVGTVAGTFKATATSQAGTTKAFSFRWTGHQWEDGKDATTPADDERITFTVKVPGEPQQLELPGDILSGGDTEHTAIYQVYPGRTLGLTGAVKIDGIKQQMAGIETSFGNPDGSSIAVDLTDFGFSATLTVPDGMTLPADLDITKVIPEGLASTFVVNSVKVEGKSVTITFALADALTDPTSDTYIDTYAKLKDAVDAAGADNGTWLRVTIPGVTVDDSVQSGEQLVVRGTVDGHFKAIAQSAAGTTRPFSFTWAGTQWAEGRDAVAGADDSIRFTAVIPAPFELGLPGDLLIGSDTTKDATPEVAAGRTVDLTGAIQTTDIKAQMAGIEASFGNPDGSTIAVDIKNFGFTAKLTLPEGMAYPKDFGTANIVATDFGSDFDVTGVSVEGQTATVSFALKDAARIDTYAKLKAAVDATGEWMKVTFKGLEVAGDLAAGTTLTSVGTVTGEFGAVATSASGTSRNFLFTWNATQWAEGKDFPATDDETIQLTLKIAEGTVTVTYVDEDGNEIATSETLTGAAGSAYTAEKKAIEGYTFKELASGSAPLEGTFGVDPQKVTLVYVKDPVKGADVRVTYVDEAGNEIADSVTLTGNVGESYASEQKVIEGYTFKGMGEGSAPVAGEFLDTAQTVIYVYVKNDEPSTPSTDEPSTPGTDEPSTPGTDEPSTPGTGESSEPGAPGATTKPGKPTGKLPFSGASVSTLAALTVALTAGGVFILRRRKEA